MVQAGLCPAGARRAAGAAVVIHVQGQLSDGRSPRSESSSWAVEQGKVSGSSGSDPDSGVDGGGEDHDSERAMALNLGKKAGLRLVMPLGVAGKKSTVSISMLFSNKRRGHRKVHSQWDT